MSRARFIAAARLEYLAEVMYYSEVETGAAVRFAEAVEHAVARALAFPHSGSATRSNTRRMFVDGFPFAVIYRPERMGWSSLRWLIMRGVLTIGAPGYVPANHRIDTDRFAADHAGC